MSQTKKVSKKEILNLTKRRVILTLERANCTERHICKISFFLDEDIFILTSLYKNLVAEISLRTGLKLIREGSFKDLTLVTKKHIYSAQQLEGRLVTFTSTDYDYVDTLKFSPGICGFVVRFGSQIITISLFEAEILLKTGILPNLLLL